MNDVPRRPAPTTAESDRELDALQVLFVRAIAWPTGAADFIAQADDDTRSAFEDAFVGSGDLDAVGRIDVYAEAYFWRLHDVLSEEFAVCAWLLGEARFRNLVTDYVLACPPRHFDLHRFGDRFPRYIGRHEAAGDRPGLDALARIEHAIARALHVVDQTPLSAESMARFEPPRWPNLRFEVAASVALINAPWAYPRLFARMLAGEGPPAKSSGTTPTLVWRRDGRVFHSTVEPDEAAALHGLIAGLRFEEICGIAATPGSEDVVPRVVGWLHGWFARGMIVEARLDIG